MPRRNEEVARLLENIAKLLELVNESPFRVRAYQEAARSITAMTEDIDSVHRAGRLDEIPHVGASIAAKIGEYLTTGRLRYYEELAARAPAPAAELLEVPSIGPARAQVLLEHGIATVPELERAAREHRLAALPGFGEKLEARIAREAARIVQRSQRMLLGVALPAAEEVARQLQTCPAVCEIAPAGSIRRMKETIGDIDILVASERPAEVMAAFTSLPQVKEVLARGPTRSSILTQDDLQIDLRVVAPAQYGAALQYFTGSKEHNIALRALAQAHGWKLSEYGLFDERGQTLAARTEQEVYAALGMDWIPPELRENRGEIEAAQRHQLPPLVTLDDIRGDLHVHSTWSDGHDPLERMVESAMARGYQYIAFADHSRSLRVARGLSIERVQEQRRRIDRLNERYAPFRVLQSAEVDILPDGTLDYPDDVLRELDLVSVSVHGSFGQPREVMTARVLRALRHPLVDILNHPTGRLLLGRSEYAIDLEAIVQTAADEGVALEIDGQPDRLDLDDVWSRRAVAAGAVLVCSSDAHAARQLSNMRYAVATARRGWVEPRHLLNTRPLDQLLAGLRRRRGLA